MVILGGRVFFMSEVPCIDVDPTTLHLPHVGVVEVQGYLAHKNTPTPLGPP